MITQKAIYHKGTYTLKEFIESNEIETTKYEKYDKQERLIYEWSIEDDNLYIYKYHKDTTKKRQVIRYLNTTSELKELAKYDKLGRCIYHYDGKTTKKTKYYKDTNNMRFLEHDKGWVRNIRYKGILKKQIYSDGEYTTFETDGSKIRKITKYDKYGNKLGPAFNSTYTPVFI